MLKWINPFNKVVDLISEVVTDKDQKIKLENALEVLKQEVYMAELKIETVPWVDAMHKMGRQIQSYLSIAVAVGMSVYGIEISPQLALLIGGPATAYTIMKGKGS